MLLWGRIRLLFRLPQAGRPLQQLPARLLLPRRRPTPAAPTGDAADAKKMQHDQAERDLKVEEKQRLLGVMPQFQVVMNGQAVPLTGGQKWKTCPAQRDRSVLYWLGNRDRRRVR
jgi:hypothetical protein